MDSQDQKRPQGSTGNTDVEKKGRFQPRSSRKRPIIFGVLIAVVVVAVVVVVVVVVTQNNKNDKSEEEKQKSEEEKQTCGPYNLPGGINISDLRPKILSRRLTCPLEGDCWTGEQCYECFKLKTWKVGNINDIPVCCPQCLLSGLKISNSKCECKALNENRDPYS